MVSWLVEDGVPQVRASSKLKFSAIREVVARERQRALSRKAWTSGWLRTRFGEGKGKLNRRRAREVLNT